MSLTIDSSYSSLLQSSVNAQLVANVASSSNTAETNSIGAITTAALGGPSTSGLTSLGSDLATLFKDLAANDTSAAQTDLTQLEKDLEVSSTSSSTSSTPLQTLFASLSSSISSGDTTSAINTLASFFLQGGSSTGNVVNTTA
ncbi:hypothetical protein [Granulicella aggregans]|uniref:hypothetical protein n=1 Tax=Granulicella aggregans TaxID=474949 RepID=UPI0021E02FFD|nr:hypothetical protein [Granulicella aggregans]